MPSASGLVQCGLAGLRNRGAARRLLRGEPQHPDIPPCGACRFFERHPSALIRVREAPRPRTSWRGASGPTNGGGADPGAVTLVQAAVLQLREPGKAKGTNAAIERLGTLSR